MFAVSAVVLLLATAAKAQHVCAGVGFYPDPADCSTFYRCTDLWNNGVFQQYTFMCPAGTVFDDVLDVCNWPWAVPSCGMNPPPTTTSPPTTTAPPTTSAPPTTTATPATLPATTEEPSTNPPPTTTLPPTTAAATTPMETTAAPTTAVGVTEAPYTPSENSPYSCTAPGVVNYDADCQKFWLCKEEPAGSMVLQSLLYRCPEGYLFSSSTLRCARADDLTCLTGVADLRSTPVNQLAVEELDAFFNRWG